jgi:hypothetical protein
MNSHGFGTDKLVKYVDIQLSRAARTARIGGDQATIVILVMRFLCAAMWTRTCVDVLLFYQLSYLTVERIREETFQFSSLYFL